jgi:hypothetical protein
MPYYPELHAKSFSDILLLQAKGLKRERGARSTALRCGILVMDLRMGTLRRMGALRPTPAGKVTPLLHVHLVPTPVDKVTPH